MRTTPLTIPTTIAALAVLLIATAASPAMAERDGWRGHHGRGHHQYHHYRPHHYRPPVYYAPRAYRPYYPPPPVYYAPPPAYYAPPIIGFGFTIR